MWAGDTRQGEKLVGRKKAQKKRETIKEKKGVTT